VEDDSFEGTLDHDEYARFARVASREDVSMPETFGVITGIMSGIAVKAQVAIQQGDSYGEPHCVYHAALERILAEAERAEGLWAQFINRELPEHAKGSK